MADSHFFIATNSSASQSSNEAFGPVLSNETTQYRVTSKFSATGDTAAYAAFTAQVFLQPSTETDKVNLILRPYKQPIKGLDIKYFIYRGLKKTDFIPSGNDDLVSFTQKDTASGFIKILWEQLVSFDSKASANPFKAKWIGYDPENQLPDTFIDDYFFAADAFADQDNESIKPFEFPIIPKGTHLGHFKGNFGLDIVLSDGDYKALTSNTGFQFNLAYARATESTIDIAATPTGYAEKQYREAIHHFMDPAAFWGLHVNDESTVKIKEATDSNILKGQQIYEKVISKFATKNNVYLHIQGHLGRSYNYYDTYGETIKIGNTIDNTTEKEYKTDSWPIHIYNEAQTHDNEVNTIFLQLKYDEAANPLLYGEVATMSDEAENNFLVVDQLIPGISTIEETEALDSYTNSIKVIISAFGNSSNKLNGANYVKLLYQGTNLEVENPELGISHKVKAINTLFGPINIEQRLKSSTEVVISWNSNYRNRLVATNKLDSGAPNNTLALKLKIIDNKITFIEGDTSNVQSLVLYESQYFEGVSDGLYLSSSPQNETSSASTIPFVKEENNTYRLLEPNYVRTQLFTDSFTSIKGLRINSTQKEYPNKFILGLSKTENDLIKTLISDTKIINEVFFLSPLFTDDTFLISPENLFYGKYKLGVLGEVGSDLNVFFPEEDVYIYTLDENIYFSSQYSQYIQDDSKLVFDLTIQRTV